MIKQLFELTNKTFDEISSVLMGWNDLHALMLDDQFNGVTSEIAESNATGWGIDSIEVLGLSVDKNKLTVYTLIWLSGEQDPDRSPWITEIAADTVIRFQWDGGYDISMRQTWTNTCDECWCHGIALGQVVEQQLAAQKG